MSMISCCIMSTVWVAGRHKAPSGSLYSVLVRNCEELSNSIHGRTLKRSKSKINLRKCWNIPICKKGKKRKHRKLWAAWDLQWSETRRAQVNLRSALSPDQHQDYPSIFPLYKGSIYDTIYTPNFFKDYNHLLESFSNITYIGYID